MTYWRMQLHPSKPKKAARYAIESLAAGLIGLGFSDDPGDLTKADPSGIKPSHRDYLSIANEMKMGDYVLIMVHHFPFALATIAGEYNYMREPEPELGVWFCHFRRVKNVRYYADYVTDAHQWERIVMTDTISPLHDRQSISYRLIDEWKRSRR